ncbi:hypothetical protein HPB47_026886 [Ixodes persulcatus]|uniref:Uncharacterized protein n=1 Tax=Ixodes persulcatus TaxID=34615 RepID=A0AC60PXF1_IXOPE|nr:hypothetical protein HPB47_026886 [Ixodes persulcatus]
MQAQRLSLITDTPDPTRQGSSVQQATSPDLASHYSPSSARWDNLHDNLGSDHFIIQISLPILHQHITRGLTPRTSLTKRDNVRGQLNTAPPPTSLLDCVTSTQDAIHHHTKHLARSENHPYIDTHLVHLWDKRHQLVHSWKKNKTNKRLKKAIQNITQEAEDYAHSLTTQNWLDTCDNMNGNLHAPRLWQIFRTLLGQTKPRRPLIKLLCRNQQSPKNLADDILAHLYPITTPPPLPTALPAPESGAGERIDSPFSLFELLAALYDIKKQTAPGLNGITYTTLRNLPDNHLDILLFYIKEAWEPGQLPEEWRTAKVILIPKPGKPPIDLNNFRPISLTSCAGKLVEKMDCATSSSIYGSLQCVVGPYYLKLAS